MTQVDDGHGPGRDGGHGLGRQWVAMAQVEAAGGHGPGSERVAMAQVVRLGGHETAATQILVFFKWDKSLLP